MTNQPYITAEEIHQLFYENKKKRQFPSWQLLTASVLIVVGIVLFVSGPAVVTQLDFWWEHDIQASRQTPRAKVGPVAPPAKPVKPANKPPQQKTLDPASLPNNTLWIPKLKTKAPIIWDVTGGKDLNSDLLTALQAGVVRYPKTALPDQIGNVFLTGHSSNYWWEKGRYKTIFALLDKLVVGDTIYVKYQGQLYSYRVSGQKVVKPTDTEVLGPTKTPTLSLMTCTPTGTALRRRIVTAELVSPRENLKPQPTAPETAALQAVR